SPELNPIKQFWLIVKNSTKKKLVTETVPYRVICKPFLFIVANMFLYHYTFED
ncbi:uncharacterized protein B0P05DRAFT_480016, partial [Gilbertella persicaria]|uniref:uncharacterized protein n=1 Tax=Gilbertella persicaria TaxID=101096 RepID=UPI00221FC8D6